MYTDILLIFQNGLQVSRNPKRTSVHVNVQSKNLCVGLLLSMTSEVLEKPQKKCAFFVRSLKSSATRWHDAQTLFSSVSLSGHHKSASKLRKAFKSIIQDSFSQVSLFAYSHGIHRMDSLKQDLPIQTVSPYCKASIQNKMIRPLLQ